MISQKLRGLAVVAAIVTRALRAGAPPPVSTAERLAGIPIQGLALHAAVQIHWDRHQVPSIEAADEWDLSVALGVVHAHLRLAQMEIMRRLALGRVAEVIGPAAVDIDHSLRMMGFGRAVPAMEAALPQTTRRWLDGFVTGVNHVIAHAGKLPYEFGLVRLQPEPWTVEHLLMISRLAATDVSWMVFARLLRAKSLLSAAEWDRLWPQMQNGDTLPWPQTVAEAALGLVRGSNSAGVAANRTAGGAAMIASDPHLPITMPPLWLIAGLHAPGLDVVGLMIPGIPVVALGRNHSIAWGGTSLHAQSSDLIDASAEPMTERLETIGVRGRAPVVRRIRETRFGPVVSDGLLLKAAAPLALRWVGHAPSDEISAMLDVMRATDLAGFRAALGRFAIPGQTMVMVEGGASGRAATVVASHAPRRAAGPMKRLVLPPADAWALDDLVIASDVHTPLEDVAVSANDRPSGMPVPMGFFYSSAERAQRLRDLLETDFPVTVEAMRALQSDVAKPWSLALLAVLLERLPALPRRTHEAVRALAEWDGGYETHSEGALVFEVLAGTLVRRLVPQPLLTALSAVWTARALTAQLILDAPPAELQRALRLGLRLGAHALRRYENWGGVHRLAIRHPLAQLPLVGHWFALRQRPVGGSNATINKTGHGLVTGRHAVTFGACARHVSDMADPDANWFVLLGGQDGWLGSANAADQVALWLAGDAIQVPLRPEAARAWPHRTVLVPQVRDRWAVRPDAPPA